jgi:hypothetical protein
MKSVGKPDALIGHVRFDERGRETGRLPKAQATAPFLDSTIMPADVLSSYPYVVVRIACRRCTRKGSYRLARLAAKYGAEIPMTELLAHLAGDCAIS